MTEVEASRQAGTGARRGWSALAQRIHSQCSALLTADLVWCPADQAVHNYLLHILGARNKLKFKHVTLSNWESPVATATYGWPMRVDAYGRLHRVNGTFPPVVHQYDRSGEQGRGGAGGGRRMMHEQGGAGLAHHYNKSHWQGGWGGAAASVATPINWMWPARLGGDGLAAPVILLLLRCPPARLTAKLRLLMFGQYPVAPEMEWPIPKCDRGLIGVPGIRTCSKGETGYAPGQI